MEHFFSLNSSGHLRPDAHQSQIIGGDADVDHTQTIRGDTVKLLRGSPHPSRVSAPLFWGPFGKRILEEWYPNIRSKNLFVS